MKKVKYHTLLFTLERKLEMDRVQQTILAYDRNCSAFADKFLEFPLYSERIRGFISLLDSGIKVLDVACGPGTVSRYLAESEKKFRIVGMDLSEGMLKLARRNVPEGQFLRMDARDICLPDNSFDAAVLSFCIVHLTEAETAELLDRLSRVLKSGGKLYLSFIEGEKSGFEKTSFSQDEIFFTHHRSEQIREFLTESNFSPIEIIEQKYPEGEGNFSTEVFIYSEKVQAGL